MKAPIIWNEIEHDVFQVPTPATQPTTAALTSTTTTTTRTTAT